MPSILVVDDEPQLLYSLRELLTLQGYQVYTAESGAEALRKLVEIRPDLIVSDIMMQDMDGHELHRRIRALTGANIPLLFLTAKVGIEERLTSLGDGADDYLTKPFYPEELCARIAAILSRVERTRAQERAELEAIRSRTFSRVAAQLREPAHALARQLDELAFERVNGDQEAQRVRLRRAIEHAHRLCELVDELQWTSADDLEQNLDWEMVRIAPILRRSAASASRKALARDVQVNITCGGLLSGALNEAAIVRALAKLLEAVVETTPRGGQVGIMARRAQDKGLEFVITEGSRRTDSSAPSENLSDALELARHVLHAHHGRMQVESLRDGRQSYVLWIPGRAPGVKRSD